MTFLEIDDTQFQCIAAGIGGNLVPETTSIIECCQDPNNLNIIYIRCNIAGVYDYVPIVTLTWEGGSADVSAFFIPNYNSVGVSSFPISTNCSSVTVLLAYDAGSAIPNFATVSTVDVTVQFIGTLASANFSTLILDANIFHSTNPSATITLDKGLIPTPYRLYFDPITQQLRVQYSNLGTTACLCSINCVTPETSDFNLTVCNDEIQEITIDNNSIVGDPTNATITFMDGIGNLSTITIHAMTQVVPAAPVALQQVSPAYINITVPFVSIYGTPIQSDKVKYQVLRYENNPDNITVWKDWTSKSWKSLYDRNIRTGRIYGYAIRFQGEFGEQSQISPWSVIEVI